MSQLDDLDASIIAAGARARQDALAAGVPVFYLDAAGRDNLVQPDRSKFEIRYIPGGTRERLFEIVRELSQTAA